jgi:hypothetical protein
MNRREFTVEAALLLLGGATIAISGCGGGASSPTMASPVTDAAGSVSSNHGHAAVITAAQLVEGSALELDIRGTSAHPHVVSLSTADVANIRRGLQVQKESSGASHTHLVTFNAPAQA